MSKPLELLAIDQLHRELEELGRTNTLLAIENVLLMQSIRDVRESLQRICKLYCDWDDGSRPASDAANFFYDAYCEAACAMCELPTQAEEVGDDT